MKRFTSIIVLLIPSFVFAQSVYMHEAQDDPANDEILTIWDFIPLAIVVGIIYFIVSLINGFRDSRKEKKREAERQEVERKREIFRNDGFVCPYCGKPVYSNEYATRIIYGKVSFRIKYCIGCENKFDLYRKDKEYYNKVKNMELPYWLGMIFLCSLVVLGIIILIINCKQGEIIRGIWFMILIPALIGFVIAGLFKLLQNLAAGSEPKEPYNTPSLKHCNDCNAIVEEL